MFWPVPASLGLSAVAAYHHPTHPTPPPPPPTLAARQWLGFGAPDPTGAQYPVMAYGLRQCAAINEWKLEDVYVWVDYS